MLCACSTTAAVSYDVHRSELGEELRSKCQELSSSETLEMRSRSSSRATPTERQFASPGSFRRVNFFN